MRYKPIELDEVYNLYQLRKTLLFRRTGKRSRLRFDKFCDMMKQGGYTIL